MRLISRPWALSDLPVEKARFGPEDCFLGVGDGRSIGVEHAVLMRFGSQELCLFPYPPRGEGERPCQIRELPARPRKGVEPHSEIDAAAADALIRMHQVLARVDELEEALDDPANVWERLRRAWDLAEDAENPRMAEIVRQARGLRPHLTELRTALRRVLRRTRERVPLDRVQEMDRASMQWLVRQPGRSMAERAGSDQRVLAIVRHDNFDTLENRVLHAYLILAARTAGQWLREHDRAQRSARYRMVDAYRRYCRWFSRELAELGVGIAQPNMPANYVLLEVRAYREVREAWLRLLRQDRAEDDLWAWQAETWNDFCTLAVTVSLAEIEGARLLAQSPILWLEEAEQGRRFRTDRPLAVFWLERSRLIVEVQPRPEGVSRLQFAARTPLWLRISSLSDDAGIRRIPIWPVHCFKQLDLKSEAQKALSLMTKMRKISGSEKIQNGIIIAPMHDTFVEELEREDPFEVRAVTLGGAGKGLAKGRKVIAEFVRDSVTGGPM